ncbi:MAG: hypothetical protein Q9163_005076 [Psora crenata]
MVLKSTNGSNRLGVFEQWDVLGPFQTGTREATWGADPLEALGGFCSLKCDPQATYHSSLAPDGLVSWTRHTVEEYFETDSLSSSLSYADAVTTRLVVGFSSIDWSFLQTIYGWAALQWQAWARGVVRIVGDEPTSILLYTDNVLEYWVDIDHFFGVDIYGYRRAPLLLHLSPGEHILNLRLVRDVRSTGAIGLPTVSIQLKAEVCSSGLAGLSDSLLLPETVSGIPAGRYGSVNLLNTSNDWIYIRGIECDNRQGDVNCLTRARDPHKITFLHPSSTVSYAILRPPSVNACVSERTSMPILLILHGAGLDAASWQVRSMLDPLPDLPAWFLFPTGVTPWSGDD